MLDFLKLLLFVVVMIVVLRELCVFLTPVKDTDGNSISTIIFSKKWYYPWHSRVIIPAFDTSSKTNREEFLQELFSIRDQLEDYVYTSVKVHGIRLLTLEEYIELVKDQIEFLEDE